MYYDWGRCVQQVACVVAFWQGLITGHQHFWAVSACLCEASTVFLCIDLISRTKSSKGPGNSNDGNGDDGERDPQHGGTGGTGGTSGTGTFLDIGEWLRDQFKLPLLLNSTMLWCCFILCRLMLLPFWLACYLRDLGKFDHMVQFEFIPTWSLVFFPLCMAVVLVRSAVWFYKCTAGMLLAVFAPGHKSTQKEE